MSVPPQRGFTLLEIVIVILIVGFVLAGALKGQELITSAKVRRVAGQLDEVRSAYFGFQDRYRALPGDYAGASANLNCGVATCLNGNGDGRIRSNESVMNGNESHEDLLLWSHLSTSGFLKGSYTMNAGDSQPADRNAPKNPYAVYLQIAFDGNFGLNGGGIPRHNLKTGAQIPVAVLMELDRKIDDGKPYRGALQFSAYSGNAVASPQEGGPAACTTSNDADAEWNFLSGTTNCGAALAL
jgi:prepilin-type N-terminal cleavage/methylation domain-containing protein